MQVFFKNVKMCVCKENFINKHNSNNNLKAIDHHYCT